MRARWESISLPVRSSLLFSLEKTINKMNEQEASNTISGLGRLGILWNSLPAHLRSSIGDAFVRYLPVLGPKGLAMSIHGLGRMSAEISALPDNFREKIMTAICNISSVVNAQEVSNILYGLGKIGTKFPDLSTQKGRSQFKENADNSYLTRCARSQLMTALTREAVHMSAQGISNSLWGLMMMQAPWNSFQPAQKLSILQALNRELCHMDEQQIGNTIFSLGSLGLHWNALKSLPDTEDSADKRYDLQEGILFTLGETLPHMTPAGVVMTLIGLGKLGVSWKSLPLSVRAKIFDSLERVFRTASYRTVSSLIFALTVCEIRWADLNSNVQTVIKESIGRSYWETLDLFATEEANNNAIDMAVTKRSIFSGESNSKKGKVDSGLRVPTMLEMESSSNAREQHLVYSLGLLDVTWEELGISAQRSICNNLKYRVPYMDEQAVVNSIYGLSCMGAKWNQLDRNLKAALLEALRRVSESMGEQGIAVTVLSLAKLDV